MEGLMGEITICGEVLSWDGGDDDWETEGLVPWHPDRASARVSPVTVKAVCSFRILAKVPYRIMEF